MTIDRRTVKNRLIPVRFHILGLIVVLSVVNYLLRNNISIALPHIRAEFAFSGTEIGWILASFNISYALFQIPGGIFGEAVGPRRALAIIAITWSVLTALTGFSPDLMAASATGAMISLIVVRFLMGIANAPVFPIAAGVFSNWFPAGSWAFPNAMLSTAITLGQAVVAPLVTMLIVAFGWRESFYILSPLGLIAAIWWWWYARDKPEEHQRVSQRELELIQSGRQSAAPPISRKEVHAVLLNRDVLLLAVSYFCLNYVFYMFAQWLFIYLVEERGLSLLESSFLYAMPFITGAVLAAVGGLACDALCRRIGPRWGCRAPAIVGMLLVAILLPAGALAADAYVAVALLSLCFGCTQFTEGAYWSAATYAAWPHASTATGVLNTGGNSAGFLAPVVGFTLDQFGWFPTLVSGSFFALGAALLWLFIRVDRSPNAGLES